jgi:cytochrome c biogenesis protein CcmG/thiol:disulfide interchange protein DsbE
MTIITPSRIRLSAAASAPFVSFTRRPVRRSFSVGGSLGEGGFVPFVSFVSLVSFVWLLAVAFLSATDARPAPAVELHRADGTAVRPSDYRGKVLLIDFWASWCVPCKASFPALDALYQRDRDRGLVVLAINLDEERKAADAFLASRPHVMPIVFDPRGESAEAFRIRGMPSSVVIDRAGNIRFTHIGYSAKVLAAYQNEINLLLSER